MEGNGGGADKQRYLDAKVIAARAAMTQRYSGPATASKREVRLCFLSMVPLGLTPYRFMTTALANSSQRKKEYYGPDYRERMSSQQLLRHLFLA